MATQTNKEKLCGGLAKVLKEQWQVDLPLKAGDSNEDGSAISVHKVILWPTPLPTSTSGIVAPEMTLEAAVATPSPTSTSVKQSWERVQVAIKKLLLVTKNLTDIDPLNNKEQAEEAEVALKKCEDEVVFRVKDVDQLGLAEEEVMEDIEALIQNIEKKVKRLERS